MKLETRDNNFILSNVFNGIGIKTEDGDILHICLRDDGWEMKINDGDWFLLHPNFVPDQFEYPTPEFLGSREEWWLKEQLKGSTYLPSELVQLGFAETDFTYDIEIAKFGDALMYEGRGYLIPKDFPNTDAPYPCEKKQ